MRRRPALTAGVLLLTVACETGVPDPYAGTPVVEQDTVWRFPSGATAVTTLQQEIQYIGTIQDERNGPYLVASGVECNFCDAGLSVLMKSVRDGNPPPDGPAPGWYAYPGDVTEMNGGLVFRSRLFWGRCLPERGSGLVQFATEFDTLGRQERHVVYVTEIRDGRLVDDSLMVRPPAVTDLEPRLADARCREIPPRPQAAAP